jgi:hypothetical protein
MQTEKKNLRIIYSVHNIYRYKYSLIIALIISRRKENKIISFNEFQTEKRVKEILI